MFGEITCKEVGLSRAVEPDDTVVHGAERPALNLVAVRLEAADADILDVHFAHTPAALTPLNKTFSLSQLENREPRTENWLCLLQHALGLQHFARSNCPGSSLS